MTKLTLRMCDIEVCIEDSTIPDNELLGIANGEIEFLIQSRIQLESGIAATQEPAEDIAPGERPAPHIPAHIHDIKTSMYV